MPGLGGLGSGGSHLTGDSGVISAEFNARSADDAADGASDDGHAAIMDEFGAGAVGDGLDVDGEGEGISEELEKALKRLTPEEIERRRKDLGKEYR